MSRRQARIAAHNARMARLAAARAARKEREAERSEDPQAACKAGFCAFGCPFCDGPRANRG